MCIKGKMVLDFGCCIGEMDATTTPNYREHDKFLRDVVEAMFKTIFGMNKASKVIEWKKPDELKNILDLDVNKIGKSQQELLKIVENTLKYSVKTGHPYFLNQLFSG